MIVGSKIIDHYAELSNLSSVLLILLKMTVREPARSSMHKISRVHTTKLAQARPRPGLGSAQVYVMSTLQGQSANVDTNLDRAQDSTYVIARNVRNTDDNLLLRKYWWKRKSQDWDFATCSVDKVMLNVDAYLFHPPKCLLPTW